MHESSYQEMVRFAERFLDSERVLKILDIGSYDVNGTYKAIFEKPNWKYIGLDLVPGPNVDVVSDEPYYYPFPDEYFDVVVSGSVLEHVRDMHWVMIEAARILKNDGIMCHIAPWTYPEHKYPEDCWRIMPDGMKFLLSEIAGLGILDIHKNETDCVGIAGTPQK